MTATDYDDDDERHYLIECSTSLSELIGLMRTLIDIEARRAAAEGVEVEEIVLRCDECGTPVSTDRDVCEDCAVVRAVRARQA